MDTTMNDTLPNHVKLPCDMCIHRFVCKDKDYITKFFIELGKVDYWKYPKLALDDDFPDGIELTIVCNNENKTNY